MKRLLAIIALLIPLASQAQTVPPIIYDIEANWQQMQALPDQDFVQGAGASLRYRLKSNGRWLDLTGLGARWDARSSITSTQALQAVATVVTSTTPHYLAISLDSTQTGDAVTNWVYRLIVTAGGKDYPLGIGDLDIEASAWTGASAILSNVTAAAYTDSAVATHAAISSAHHARYTDAEAIAAAGTNFASVVQGAKADEAYGWGDHGTNDYQTGEQITNAILDLSTAGIVLWGDTNAHPTVAGYATLANSMPATQQTYVFSGVTNGGYVTDQMWLSEDEYAQVAAGIFKFVVNLNWSASSHPLATFRTQPEVCIYEQGGIITNMLAAATYQTWDFDSGIRRREGSLHNASAITSTGGNVRVAVRLKAIVSGGYTVGGTLYLGDGYPGYIEMPSPAGFWATAANLTAHEDETLAGGAHGGEADTLQSVVVRGGTVTNGVVTIDAENARTNTFGGALTVLGRRIRGGGATSANGTDAVALGHQSSADGNFSLALGPRSAATNDYSIVISDRQSVFSTAPDQLTLSFDGGIRLLGGPVSGNISGATNLPVAGISATGTPSSSTYLRGDGSWETPAGGGIEFWPPNPDLTDYAWETNAGQITIAGWYGAPGPATIPDYINGLPVVAIGDSAFGGTDVASISGGANVATIGNNAFDSCRNLTSVPLPQATTIGDHAFAACTALTNVPLPQATTIGDHAFAACTALTNVPLPQATTICDAAFDSCANLTSVYFGHSAPVEGIDVFQNATNAIVYVTNPVATGWGTEWNGQPVVRLPVYGGGNLSATNPPTAGQMLYASDATLTNLYFAAAPAGGGTLESYLGTPQNLGVTNAYLWTPTRFACDLAPTAAYTFAINPAYTNFPGAVYHGIILSTNTITLGANMTRLGAAVTPTGTNLFTSRLKNDGTGTNWWFKMAVQ